jgi:hypothetical protein
MSSPSSRYLYVKIFSVLLFVAAAFYFSAMAGFSNQPDTTKAV